MAPYTSCCLHYKLLNARFQRPRNAGAVPKGQLQSMDLKISAFRPATNRPGGVFFVNVDFSCADVVFAHISSEHFPPTLSPVAGCQFHSTTINHHSPAGSDGVAISGHIGRWRSRSRGYRSRGSRFGETRFRGSRSRCRRRHSPTSAVSWCVCVCESCTDLHK
jgi:hypothetical protein